MAHLSICLFGPFRASLDGLPVTAFESDKVRALLAYLAVEADVPHRREKLAGLLWPDWTESAARANLSRALTNLRQSIGDREGTRPLLNASRQAIQFNRGDDAWVDVPVFVELMGQGDGPGLTRAVELYRGPFLEGFSLPGCPEFEEWVLLEGERLQRLALRALEQLSAWHEEGGELAPALQHAWRQVELAPWHEAAQRRVMRLLARTGQRGEALAHYETCRRALADELGVEPSAETVTLYEQIRQEPPRAAPCGALSHNLRVPLTPFVGREAELAELGARLRDPDCRLLTLVGPGGIGKTRLAVEAARKQMERFPQGVFQVRLAGLQSVEAIVPTVAEAIGLAFYRQGDAKQQLLEYLSQKTMLLILDNFEHLLGGVETVIELLQAAPGVRMVVTSRTRLNLQGEHLFPVEGMAVPPPEPGLRSTAARTAASLWPVGEGGEPKEVAEYDAVKLFVSGALRVRPGFRLAGQAGPVSRICHQVDGMPLAILLASSWAGALSPAEIEDRIREGLDLLQADWRDVPQRHRSMRAVFEHSWKVLSDREQEILGALSVFRGGFCQEAAQAVARATPGELWGLVDKSFVHRFPSGRYEVHELLRQYAAERLLQPGGREGARTAWEGAHERHCGYYVGALQRWGEELKGAQQQAALGTVDVEIENARAAWAWAVERRQVARLAHGLEGLCLFYEWRVRSQEGETACRLAAGGLAGNVEGPGLVARIRVLAWQGAFQRMLGHMDAAGRLLDEALALLEEQAHAGQDLAWERGFLLFQRAQTLLHSDRQEAGRSYGQSVDLFRAAGDDWWAANAQREQGRAAFHRGAFGEARPLIEQALAARRTLGDMRGIADALEGLGALAMFQGDLEAAVRMMTESAELFHEAGCRVEGAGCLGNLGAALATAGRLEEGRSALEESVLTLGEMGDDWGLAFSEGLLGVITMWQGRYEEAQSLADRSYALSQRMGYWRGCGVACWGRAGAALARGAYRETRAWAEEWASLSRRIEDRDYLAIALGLLGSAQGALGRPAEARKTLCEGLRLAAETQSYAAALGVLPLIPLLLAGQGENVRAVELYALVVAQFPVVPVSPWFEDAAGRQMAAVAEALPVEVVAAAQARGRGRELWATVAEVMEELG